MMRIAATGFVSTQAGSVASANALLLQALLDRGCEITFFSKASFVDPRPAVGNRVGFKFVDVDNRLADRIRARLARIPLIGMIAGIIDAKTYTRLLVKRIREAHLQNPFQICLWLGDYASGSIPGLPTVSFAQGPPGTDARSIINHFDSIRQLAGAGPAWKWNLLAKLRLSPIGLPPLAHSDRIVVGSEQSRRVLQAQYGQSPGKLDTLPYPIDLEMFRPTPATGEAKALNCLWLGRIIPRKRLDLFLDGAAQAIRNGSDIRLTIVGGIGFVPGYEKLIRQFPYPERMTWIPSLPREQVPQMLAAHDVLIQCSEEENFGSSIAEAQACGVPTIIGTTNGNGDYLCSRDLKLNDYRPETLARVLEQMSQRKARGELGNPRDSRACAEKWFSLEAVTDRLFEILQMAARRSQSQS